MRDAVSCDGRRGVEAAVPQRDPPNGFPLLDVVPSVKRTPLKRKTPIRRKRPTPRRVAVTCTMQRCRRRPAPNIDLCITHGKREADRLFSIIVRRRDGRCQSCGTTADLQCAHLASRRYLATRWDLNNAVALCRACHQRFTVNPVQWTVWLLDRLGDPAFAALHRKAVSGLAPDLAVQLAWLRDKERGMAEA